MKKFLFLCIIVIIFIWNFILDNDDIKEIKKEVGSILTEASETTKVKLKEARETKPEVKTQKERGKKVMEIWSGKTNKSKPTSEMVDEKKVTPTPDVPEPEKDKGGTTRKAL